MPSARASQLAFFGVSTLIFVASATLTITWSMSMSAMGGMEMPGGWTMSMAWMRMPGQTWLGAAASFLGMWVLMMVAMMLPSLAPMLWRYRQPAGSTGETRLGRLTALVGVGYFFVCVKPTVPGREVVLLLDAHLGKPAAFRAQFVAQPAQPGQHLILDQQPLARLEPVLSRADDVRVGTDASIASWPPPRGSSS